VKEHLHYTSLQGTFMGSLFLDFQFLSLKIQEDLEVKYVFKKKFYLCWCWQ